MKAAFFENTLLNVALMPSTVFGIGTPSNSPPLPALPAARRHGHREQLDALDGIRQRPNKIQMYQLKMYKLKMYSQRHFSE